MKYNELKAQVKILKKHGYSKCVGWGVYEHIYTLNDWHYRHTICIYEVASGIFPLDDYLHYLYEKNMKLLMEYDIEDYAQKIKFSL